ncbi:MAG: Uma2 family endonuclease [Rhizobacter sp.]|nr:Uma2 family endonuclease [Chlorobiales bacterium]
MTWQEICESPQLRDLPFKIETNGFGQILMSPASNWHARRQVKIAATLENQKSEGEVFSECSVLTAAGVKVADVAWGSAKFVRTHHYETPYPLSPELCVEITSPSNSRAEMQEKIMLYLAKGAKEVWLCSDTGAMKFFVHEGETKKSALFPKFPKKI